MCLLNYLGKDIPRITAREVHPHIRSILGTIDVESKRCKCVNDDISILLVESDNILHSLHRNRDEKKRCQRAT